jgi:biopolymer transport protein TolQ
MPDVTANADMMSPLNLFLHADIVVKIVMLGLLLASVWTWSIIFTPRDPPAPHPQADHRL